jgi:hypothetical protein
VSRRDKASKGKQRFEALTAVMVKIQIFWIVVRVHWLTVTDVSKNRLVFLSSEPSRSRRHGLADNEDEGTAIVCSVG